MLSSSRRKLLEAALVELRWRYYAQNPERFFAECVWVPSQGILDVDKQGKVLFETFPYQRETLATFLDRRYVIVLKARQLGLTTLADAYALWQLLFRPGSNILLVSKDQPTADKALDLLNFMFRFLPAWMQPRLPELTVDSAREMVWTHHNGIRSRIVSRPATKTVGAGETATLVMWDEAALAVAQDESLRSLMPTTDAGGSMIIFSTARGGHNTFARIYRDAEAGRSEFHAVFHPWHVSRLMNLLAEDGKIDMSRYEGRRLQMADKPWQFYAEYPSDPDEAFRQSGRTRFPNLPSIEEFQDFEFRGRLIEEAGAVQFVHDPEGPLFFDQFPPEVAGPTVVSVDPSEGVGGDYTAMSAGFLAEDGTPVRVAFWHDNQTEPAAAAAQAAMLGRFLRFRGREALMVVEKQGGFGETIIHELREHWQYRNIYIHTYTGHRKKRREQAYGMPMTATRRPMVIDALAKWVAFGSGKPVMEGVDRKLRIELGAFVVTDSGRVEADIGMHDDLVMSTAIMVYVLTETLRPAVSGSNGDMRPVTSAPKTMSLTSIWEDAEDNLRRQDRENRKYGRQLARAMRK